MVVRLLATVVASLGLCVATLAPPASASATPSPRALAQWSAAPADGAVDEPADEVALDVADDVVRHPDAGGARTAGAREATVSLWPTKTIRIGERLPWRYSWSVRKAVAEWNAAGIGVRLRRVEPQRAQVMIRFGDTGAADAVATLGYSADYPNFVHLRRGRSMESWFDRELMSRVIAHELGHNLGLEHNNRSECGLMRSTLSTSCIPRYAIGWYGCRWVKWGEGRFAARLYGGAFRIGARRCLTLPLPGQLAEVAWDGGQPSGPVQATWRETTLTRGARVVVTATPETCDRTAATEVFLVDPLKRRWADQNQKAGDVCYALRIANRLGVSRPTYSDTRARYAPRPGLPKIKGVGAGSAASEYVVSLDTAEAALPEGTSLQYVAGAADTCPAAWTPDLVLTPAVPVEDSGSDYRIAVADPLATCASFFLTDEWGNTSDGVVWELPPVVPGLPEPL